MSDTLGNFLVLETSIEIELHIHYILFESLVDAVRLGILCVRKIVCFQV